MKLNWPCKIPELANKSFNEHIEWKVSEVLPEYILLENNILGFDKGHMDRSICYPWLTKLKEEIRPIWERRTSFRGFAIDVYKNYIEKY